MWRPVAFEQTLRKRFRRLLRGGDEGGAVECDAGDEEQPDAYVGVSSSWEEERRRRLVAAVVEGEKIVWWAMRGEADVVAKDSLDRNFR